MTGKIYDKNGPRDFIERARSSKEGPDEAGILPLELRPLWSSLIG